MRANYAPPNFAGIKSSRFVWVDAAKGVAILLVLLSHSDFGNFCSYLSESLPGISYVAKLISYATASYMPLFYVLSGYTFKDAPDVLKKRFMRLMTPYFIWGTFALLVSWGYIFMAEHSFLSFFRPAVGLCYSRFSLYPLGDEPNIRLLPFCSGALWFLTSLFTSYACFMLLYKFQRYKWALIAIYIVAIIAMTPLPVLLPWSVDTAPAGALFIFLGYKMKEKKWFSLSLYKKLFSFVVLICVYKYLVSLNGPINMSVREYGRESFLSPILFLLIGGVGSYLYCVCCQILEKIRLAGMLAYVGRISLTLLCSHLFVFYVGRKLTFYAYQHFTKSDFQCPYTFVVEVASAIIFAVFLERLSQWRRALVHRNV